MSYSNYINWTAIIRDLYYYINKSSFEERLKKIDKFKLNKYNFGIKKVIHLNNLDNFKFYIYNRYTHDIPNLNKKGRDIFYNNPYITTNLNYPNLIYFKIFDRDDKDYKIHKIKYYCNILNFKEYNTYGDIHFTESEINKVKKYLPPTEFIFIQPNYKKNKEYPFDKFQEIVNEFKDKILFIQDGPLKIKNSPLKIKNNCNERKLLKYISDYNHLFTFRQSLLFMTYAKIVIVNNGSLKIGAEAVKAKTIELNNDIIININTIMNDSN